MGVNDRLTKIEEHLVGQDKRLDEIKSGQDKILEHIGTTNIKIAEAHESLRWIKIVGGGLISFLSTHAAWLHMVKK